MYKKKERERYSKMENEDKEMFLIQNGYSSEDIKLVVRESGMDVVRMIRERERERMG